MGLVGDRCDDAKRARTSSPKSLEEFGVEVCIWSYKIAIGYDDGELDDIVNTCFGTNVSKNYILKG